MSSTMGTDFRRIAGIFVLCTVSACNVSPSLSMSGQPCSFEPCPQIGVYLDTTIAATRAELAMASLELEIVKNGAAVRVTPTLSPDGTRFTCDTIGPLPATCHLTPIDPGQNSWHLALHITGLDSDFVDGDRYAVTLGALSVADTIKSYQTSRPGSEHCELQCRFAVLSP